jgi:hypothetical protein
MAFLMISFCHDDFVKMGLEMHEVCGAGAKSEIGRKKESRR